MAATSLEAASLLSDGLRILTMKGRLERAGGIYVKYCTGAMASLDGDYGVFEGELQ